MEVVDLSHIISEDMPVYPGDSGPRIETISNIENAGYDEKRLIISTHTGTHIDVPKHIFKDGYSIEKYPAKKYIGQAIMVTLTNTETIDVEQLAPYENALRDCDFLIVNTGWSKYWGDSRYYYNPPSFSIEAARWLSFFELKGIGIDSPNVDKMSDRDYPVHHVFLEKEIFILENLANLDKLKKPAFTLYCLPLIIEGADGCPVRAVALY